MSGSLDRELGLRGIAIFTVGLAAVLVLVGWLMWMASEGLRERVASDDPPLAALPEARFQEQPPEPRLQTDPVGELELLRAEEAALLGSWKWVDEAAGVARIPIDEAIAIVAGDAHE